MGIRWAALVAIATGCGFQISTEPSPVVDAETPADSDPVEMVDAGEQGVDADPMLCGNDAVDSGEECDDGNVTVGDGCTSCGIEPAWQCTATGCSHVVSLMFSPREALASAGSSGGGGAFAHSCPPGAAIVGFEGDASDGVTDIGRLRAACAKVSFEANGNAVWSTTTNTPYVGSQMAGALGTRRCANDSVVVGYVANAGQYLSGLRPICMPLRFVHGALEFGAPVTLTMFGPATRVLQTPTQCAAGEATNVFEGQAGSVFDHFDLRCAAMTPVTQ